MFQISVLIYPTKWTTLPIFKILTGPKHATCYIWVMTNCTKHVNTKMTITWEPGGQWGWLNDHFACPRPPEVEKGLILAIDHLVPLLFNLDLCISGQKHALWLVFCKYLRTMTHVRVHKCSKYLFCYTQQNAQYFLYSKHSQALSTQLVTFGSWQTAQNMQIQKWP